MRFLVIVCAMVFVTGCTHQGSVGSVRASNIYSGHEGKIPGKVTYTIDTNSLSKLKKDDSVSGYACSAHRYPVDGGMAFAISVPSMLEAVFEEDAQSSEVPNMQSLHLVFRVERFEPRLKFNQKFFGMDADASVELGISAIGTRAGKRVFGTTVDSQRNRSGDGGAMCAGGGEVVADATRDVIKDVLEKLGERLANSQQLRVTKNE